MPVFGKKKQIKNKAKQKMRWMSLFNFFWSCFHMQNTEIPIDGYKGKKAVWWTILMVYVISSKRTRSLFCWRIGRFSIEFCRETKIKENNAKNTDYSLDQSKVEANACCWQESQGNWMLLLFSGVLKKKIRTRAVFKETPRLYINRKVMKCRNR